MRKKVTGIYTLCTFTFMKQIIIILCLHISALAVAQINAEHLNTGDQAPAFTGTDQYGNTIDSKQLLQDHENIVLIFYRGAWCPHCQKHMSALQDSLQLILDKNIAVVVVTPETPESIKTMTGKTGATFSIIHDKGYTIMNDYLVAYTISKETVPKYTAIVTKRTAQSNGNADGQLPVPATYIIGKDGKIKYVHYDPDYSKRASMAVILGQL